MISHFHHHTYWTWSPRSLCHPQGISADQIYICQRWCLVQHITNKLWSRWAKEFLQYLQTRNKWQSVKRNFCVGVIVLLCQNEVDQNRWPMIKLTEVFKDSSGYFRSVKMEVGKTNMKDQSNITLETHVTKIVLLCESK